MGSQTDLEFLMSVLIPSLSSALLICSHTVYLTSFPAHIYGRGLCGQEQQMRTWEVGECNIPEGRGGAFSGSVCGGIT